MSKKPEALRLADGNDECAKAWLESSDAHKFRKDTAAELRRLHAKNAVLVTQLSSALEEVNSVKALNQELLEALRSVWIWMEDQADGQSKGGHATFDLMLLREQRDIVRAAIDKAEGAV